PGAAGGDFEHGSAAAIGAHLVADESLVRVAAGDEDGAGAVSKEGGGALVLWVDDPAVGIAANDEGEFAVAGGDVLGGGDQGVHKAGAGGLHVHGGGVESEPILHEAGGRGAVQMVGGEGADDEQ